MQYIIGFIVLLIIVGLVIAIALWLINFLLIALKWISLIGIFGFTIYAIIKLIKSQKGKKISSFFSFIGLAILSLIIFGVSNHYQPKLHTYLTTDSEERQEKKVKESDVEVASKSTESDGEKEEANNKAEEEAKKKAEEEAKKKAEEEAKKKAEAEAKKKAEAEAKKKAEEEAKKPISNDFSSFDNPYDNMTDLQKDDFWKKVKGKYVQWTGEVVEVTEKTISVKCESDTFIDDFGATIIKKQRDSLIDINIGETITIYGQLSLKEGAILSWQLDNAKIIK